MPAQFGGFFVPKIHTETKKNQKQLPASG